MQGFRRRGEDKLLLLHVQRGSLVPRILSHQERAIRIMTPSLRIEDTLSRTGHDRGIIDGRTMLKTAIVAWVLLALTITGGCKEQGKDANAPVSKAAADKNKSPNYYGLIEEYQGILAGDPHNLAAIIALGNAYFDAGEWKQAIRHYEQALELDPANANVITDMGTCYRNMGMPDRAIAEYERALKSEPAHQNALFNLGVVYGYDRKDYAAAIRYWEQLLHVSPKHPQADYLQATMAQFRKAMRQKTK